MFSRFRKIKSAELPRVITTKTCGSFELILNYLVERDGALHWLKEGETIAGDSVQSEFVRYGQENEEITEVPVGFHPPKRGRIEPEAWSMLIDERYSYLVTNWKRIISDGTLELKIVLENYDLPTSDITSSISELSLSRIKILASGNDELSFGPCKLFPSFDLSVEISGDEITSMSLDG